MATFTQYDRQSAPEASRPVMDAVEADFGFVPNLERYLAASPAALEGYASLWEIFSRSSFSPVEQEVVYLTINYEHDCRYCMAAHTGLAKQKNMPEPVIEALRSGQPIPDARLQALRRFTRLMVQQRGWAGEAEVDAFLDAGYEPKHVFEVILGIAVKVMSNYTNHITGTGLDRVFEKYAWKPPEADV